MPRELRAKVDLYLQMTPRESQEHGEEEIHRIIKEIENNYRIQVSEIYEFEEQEY